MARQLTPRPSPTPLPVRPSRGVKAATYQLLLDTAMACIRERGHIPSVSELAAQAQISRATAYRYMPSRAALVNAVMAESLGPVRAFASTEADGRSRVHELFNKTFPLFRHFEAQMRAAAQLSLEQWAQAKAGGLTEEPYRRGHRVGILEHALEPLAKELPKAVLDRLHRALSVIYGIEPYVILKDIWALEDREVERLARWMTDALISQALNDAATAQAARRSA